MKKCNNAPAVGKVEMDVNNAGFKIIQNLDLKMFVWKGKWIPTGGFGEKHWTPQGALSRMNLSLRLKSERKLLGSISGTGSANDSQKKYI